MGIRRWKLNSQSLSGGGKSSISPWVAVWREDRHVVSVLCEVHVFCIFYVFCVFCAFCVLCAMYVVQSLMRPAKRCGVVGEAAEFNLWHRISRRAREPAVRYIHTTHCYIHTTLPTYFVPALHAYYTPCHAYITKRVGAGHILTNLWSHAYTLHSRVARS